MKSYQMLIIGVLLAVALIFAGCTSSSGTAPGVTITSPKDKATITGSNVTMTIQITNFAITPQSMDMNNVQGMQNKAGSGHIHWFIDVPAPTDTSKKAETAEGTWKMHDDTSYTFTNVQPGTHTLSVELVNNDMTPLSQPVYQTITVMVQ